jgi:hypothetical protein
VGNKGAIDNKAKEWIGKFYSRIKLENQELPTETTQNGNLTENPNPDQQILPQICAFCSKKCGTTKVIFNNKTYCSNECSFKQQEKDNSSSQTPLTGNLTQARTQVFSAIQIALNLEPKLTTGDLSTEYQDYEKNLSQLDSENKINDLKEKVLLDIQFRRMSKQESAALDEKINSAQKEVEKVDLFKEVGKKLGEETPEQVAKLEQIKTELATPQLRVAIQNEVNAQMTAFAVQLKDLSSDIRAQ